MASTPRIPLDGVHYEAVDMVEWVAEAGDRSYLVQLSQEHDHPVAGFGADLAVSASSIDAPTTIGRIIPASQRAAQADIAKPRTAIATSSVVRNASVSPAPLGSTLPAPTWWNGTKCDTAQNSRSYPLNSATVRGVLACGPLPETSGDSGTWGSISEWQCTELSERYMYLAGYISAQYAANGGEIVANYAGSGLQAETSGASPTSPALGDVVSMGTTHVEGHTALVLANHVDSTGNGYVNILQQNFTSDGSGRMNVVNGVLQSEESGYSASWLHDPRNDAPTPPAALPPSQRGDFNGDKIDDLLAIDGSGNASTYLGTGGGSVGGGLAFGSGWNGFSQVAVGDFDGDGKADAIAINDSTGIMYFYKGDGTGHIAAQVQMGPGWTGYSHLLAGHFFGTSNLDLFAVTPTGAIAMFKGIGTGTGFDNAVVSGSGWGSFTRIYAGDFRGDGFDDLFTIDGSGNARTYLNNGAGSVGGGLAFGSGWNGFSQVAVGDFDGDGKADVIGINDATGTPYLYKGDGAGGIASQTQVGQYWTGFTHLLAGHFFGTANLDLFAVKADGTIASLPNLGGAVFGNAIVTGQGWTVFSRIY